MDIVIVWLVIEFLLGIGLIVVGFLIERAVNHKAEVVLASPNSQTDGWFSAWVLRLSISNPRLLAAILSSMIPLCYSFGLVLIFLIPPFPLPAEASIEFTLFGTFSFLLLWIPHFWDRAKEFRRNSVEST